jgi:hypothetical protein
MGNDGIFCSHLEYIMVIWYILCLLGNLCSANLVYFPHFGIVCQNKSGNPDVHHR